MSFAPMAEWDMPIHRFVLGAGPCSAESETQIMDTAAALAGSGISFLRAGIWKPRTRPGHFEGVGEKGLAWLQRAKRELGVRLGVEVATPEHVASCLAHGIDVVWIGARTTPNPFAIQSLADALKGSNVSVLVKNPISPDIELWIGAIERFYAVGLRKIGAIHRGFSTPAKDEYRFSPHWRLPIELKRRLPGLPLICDPSHICGRRDLIQKVAQEALDLLFDGLMIEVHIHPEEALSDAQQQLDPASFASLIDGLVTKHEESDLQSRVKLQELREDVDEIDQRLLDLLGQRMAIVRKMAALKRKEGVSAFQPHRWEEIVKSRIADGKGHGLSEQCVFELFQVIHEEAIQQQEGILLNGQD